MAETSVHTLIIFCSLICVNYGYLYAVKSFTVPVDHFDFGNNKSFEIRYLINDSYWRKDGGPIFFYTGNEGAIEWFANNTGFMWEIAPKFGALLLFAEHRYYGHSLPFGNRSFSGPEFTGFLSTQQALADYVNLLTSVRNPTNPVIAFGGSYGGMLAAYMRMKYPHIIAGSIAASAPIWQFEGMVPCFTFSRIATSVFQSENVNCSENIRSSWNALSATTQTDDGKKWLQKEWKLCSPIKNDKNLQELREWLFGVYGNLAMANYPYPASFLGNLPANPVRVFCQQMANNTKGNRELLSLLFKGLSVYMNYTGEAKCLDYSQADPDELGDLGWQYQSCTEMAMPMCSDNKNDMFYEIPWNATEYSKYCYDKFKTRPQLILAEKIYGGKNIGAASNIVFSNGLLDPWSGGGVLKSISPSLVSIIIPEGAHHLDLRESNPSDPMSVRQARKYHQKFIKQWISSFVQDYNVSSARQYSAVNV